MGVTVSTAFLFSKAVSNWITTYFPFGAFGRDSVYCFVSTFLEATLPNGFLTEVSICGHCSFFTADRNITAASSQLSAYLPASIILSHDSALSIAAASAPSVVGLAASVALAATSAPMTSL